MQFTINSVIKEVKQIECPRCDGKGRLPEFSHVLNGRCFLCVGYKIIDLKSKYPKKGLVCKVAKGFVNQPHAVIPGIWVNKYRTCLVLSYDGGERYQGVSSAPVVWGEDKNNPDLEKLRDVWRWAKNAGAEMIVEEK